MIRNRNDIEPVVGKPVKFDQMIIVPTYVRESETPQPNGACLTHDYTDREINPAGWYVEYTNVKSGQHHRTFVPFGALSELPDHEVEHSQVCASDDQHSWVECPTYAWDEHGIYIR